MEHIIDKVEKGVFAVTRSRLSYDQGVTSGVTVPDEVWRCREVVPMAHPMNLYGSS